MASSRLRKVVGIVQSPHVACLVDLLAGVTAYNPFVEYGFNIN